MTPFVLALLRRRWGPFVCALASFAVGVLAVVFTIPSHLIRVDGTVAAYTRVENVTGAYNHNELRLDGNQTVYKLDDSEYAPAPPDALPPGTPVSIWVNQGTVWILAISLPNGGGAGSHKYTTFPYDHPDLNLEIGRAAGGFSLLLGASLAGMGLAWKQLPWRRRRKPSYVPTYLAPGMYDQDQPRS
jgi:hypothetical protein